MLLHLKYELFAAYLQNRITFLLVLKPFSSCFLPIGHLPLQVEGPFTKVQRANGQFLQPSLASKWIHLVNASSKAVELLNSTAR